MVTGCLLRCGSALCAIAIAVSVPSQCFSITGNPVTLVADSASYPANDEGKTAEMPLGFTFPMSGVSYTISHCVVDSNGEVYLTDGNGVVNPSAFGTSSITTLRGGVGGSARVMAVGGDNHGMLPTSQVLTDSSVAGQFKVTWVDWSHAFASQDWDCSVTLFASGEIRFDYSQGFSGFNFWDFVGLSRGDDVGSSAVGPRDLSAGGDSGSLGLLYQNTWPPFDLGHSSLTFTPNGVGGYSYQLTCSQEIANHSRLGHGCYEIPRQCVYEWFATPAAAQAALQGQSMIFVPQPSLAGYSVLSSSVAYLNPSPAAQDLVLGDEAEANVVPSQPFPHIDGPVATLSVCSNGFVNMGPIGSNLIGAYGSIFDMVHSPVASFRSNADYDPGSAGAVLVEEVAGILYVTWRDVVRFGGAGLDRFQMQFDLNSGAVAFVWDQLSSAVGGPSIVGYAPGPSLDPSSLDLNAVLPLQTLPDVHPINLSASPAPISTLTSGTQVVYQIDNIPDANGNSGVFFGLTIMTLVAIDPGIELSLIGMPGCSLYLSSLEVTSSFIGASASQLSTLSLPPGVPAGVEFFTQAVALVAPNSLPNGGNDFGAVSSNAVRSYVNSL
jgi:hypothetical protein